MSCIGYNKYQSPGEHLKAIGEMDSWNNGSRHQIDLTVKFNKIIELNTANHVRNKKYCIRNKGIESYTTSKKI